MAGDDVVRRLQAWHAGKPLPKGSTRHFPIAPDANALRVAFVRMAGESSPWGVGWKGSGGRETALTVPEARNRDLVAEMAAEFAPVLLEHFGHPEFSDLDIGDPKGDRPLRQLWLPNPTHLEMLHYLSYSYTFTKWGDRKRAKVLNALGRLAGWLFREAHRPGQVTVMVASDLLRYAYVFPSESVRQAHLGYLLAWLTTTGGRDARLAAAQSVERESIATTLDPALERDRLEPLVTRWFEAFKASDKRTQSAQAALIERTLLPEIRRRLNLVDLAIRVLRDDKRRLNAGVRALEAASREEHWYQYLRFEVEAKDEDDGPVFVPSPETDRYAPAAASRYFIHQASEDHRISVLVHDDEELQDEVIAAGEGIRGRIIAVTDEGEGRATIPVWRILVPDLVALRIRTGSRLCVAGLAKRSVEVRTVERAKPGELIVEVEVTGCKTHPRDAGTTVRHGADPAYRGTIVTLVPSSSEGISRRKSQRVWGTESPGSWLTHGKPAGRKAALPAEIAEDLKKLTGVRA